MKNSWEHCLKDCGSRGQENAFWFEQYFRVVWCAVRLAYRCPCIGFLWRDRCKYYWPCDSSISLGRLPRRVRESRGVSSHAGPSILSNIVVFATSLLALLAGLGTGLLSIFGTKLTTLLIGQGNLVTGWRIFGFQLAWSGVGIWFGKALVLLLLWPFSF